MNFPYAFKYGGTCSLDEVNPYHVMDGKWGGFGPTSWFRIEKEGIAPKNVYEKSQYYPREWVRVWDHSLQKWRPIYVHEHKLLPDLSEENEYLKKQIKRLNDPEVFGKITLPIINKTFPEVSVKDLLEVQPMKDS